MAPDGSSSPSSCAMQKNDHKVSNCEFPGKGRLVNNAWELDYPTSTSNTSYWQNSSWPIFKPGNDGYFLVSSGVCRLASFWDLPYRIHGTAFLGFSSAKGLGLSPSNPWLLGVACAVSPPRKNDTRVLGNVIFVDLFCDIPFPQWICHMATSLPSQVGRKSPASCAVSQAAHRVTFRCLTMYMYYVCKSKVILKIYTVCINVEIYLIYLCILWNHESKKASRKSPSSKGKSRNHKRQTSWSKRLVNECVSKYSRCPT